MNYWYEYLFSFGMGAVGCVIAAQLLNYFFPIIVSCPK